MIALNCGNTSHCTCITGCTSTALMIWRTPSVPTRVTARCRLSTGRSWTL
jgi:hypothetical protein